MGGSRRRLGWICDRENAQYGFERLTGFREAGYRKTQARLCVVDGRLIHAGTGETFAGGALTLPSVADLRAAICQAQPIANALAAALASTLIRATP